MRYLIPLFCLAAYAPSALADNIAACEIVLMEEIEDEDMQGSAQIASYRPAADFIASVYDEEEGHVKDIDGIPIRGVMCERKSIIPTEFDYPIIQTGIPLSLSPNFDSNVSPLITIFFKGDKFWYKYKGPDLTEEQFTSLDDRMEILNFQPHELSEAKREKIEIVKLPKDVQDYHIVLKPKAEELGITEEIIANLITENLGFDEVVSLSGEKEGDPTIIRAPDTQTNYQDILDAQVIYNKKGAELPLTEVVEFVPIVLTGAEIEAEIESE